MNNKKAIIQLRALSTLNDELRNPEKCFCAFEKYHIVKRLATVLNNLPRKNAIALERALLNVGLIATYLDGALKVVAEEQMLDLCYDLIIGEDCVSWQTASTLSILASHLIGRYIDIVRGCVSYGFLVIVAEEMIKLGHYQKIMVVLERLPHFYDLYVALAYLIERSPGAALQSGYFEFLVILSCRQPHCQFVFFSPANSLNCFRTRPAANRSS